MNISDISVAIAAAQKGIAQYRDLMKLAPEIDVSKSKDFQKKYNAFYRVQRRKESWYQHYYALMQQLKSSQPTFHDVLDMLYQMTGRYEPSFASKLVATIDPSKPIWDVHILRNTSHKPPSYSHKAKLSLAKTAYDSIVNWYAEFLLSEDGNLCISEFNRLVPNNHDITDIKKVDFILWQMRPPRTKKPRQAKKSAAKHKRQSRQ
jgi:hypothetical protein